MRERERIQQFFAPLSQGELGSFNLTDDAALLTPPPGQSLVITTDSVIETIHVLAGATATQFAQKLVRRNLSDLAAMGAMPWRYSLNLHTPNALPDAWFKEFSATLAAEQAQFGMVLVGGDSTAAEAANIHLSMTCIGVLSGPPLRRHGAQAGDDIYVSGTIGDAAMGLRMLQQNMLAESSLIARYHTPEPRLALGFALPHLAHAAMDISDGLLSDLSQLCAISGVGAQVLRDAIPRSAAAQHWLDRDATLWDMVWNGGDDYELCFTAPASARSAIAQLSATRELPLTCIGTITPQHGVRLVDAQGETITGIRNGWEHS